MNISIIIPCYNEGNKIKQNITAIINELNELKYDYNIVIVNDGSTDNTAEIISTINYNNVYIYSYEHNMGKGFAVKSGAQYLFDNNLAKNYINFMDADLSTDLQALEVTAQYIDQYDIVIGSRRLKESIFIKEQSLLRKFIGYCCLCATKLITKIPCLDTQCGFKTFNKETLQLLIKKQAINRFAFDIEYLYIAQLYNKLIKEIPVIWENDSDSKVAPIKSTINSFIELLKIRKNKKYYLS